MSFPVDGRVVHEICTTLAQLDPDGSTLVRGTTSIGSSTGRISEPVGPGTPAAGRDQHRGLSPTVTGTRPGRAVRRS